MLKNINFAYIAQITEVVKLNLPPATPLQFTSLKENLIKPYPHRNFDPAE